MYIYEYIDIDTYRYMCTNTHTRTQPAARQSDMERETKKFICGMTYSSIPCLT